MRRNINDYFKDVDENVQKAELGDDTARDNCIFYVLWVSTAITR